MPNIENPTEKTLAELDITSVKDAVQLFTDLMTQSIQEDRLVQNAEQLERFRIKWIGRKSGILSLVTENWLKPAPLELKRDVGLALNAFRPWLEKLIEARRVAIESGAEEAALVRERVDLSLPGVVRPIGSRHLIRE